MSYVPGCIAFLPAVKSPHHMNKVHKVMTPVASMGGLCIPHMPNIRGKHEQTVLSYWPSESSHVVCGRWRCWRSRRCGGGPAIRGAAGISTGGTTS